MISRRHSLALLAAAGTVPLLVSCGPNATGGGGSGGSGDGTSLRFSWWGNSERAETT